jgi:hypothetical protein
MRLVATLTSVAILAACSRQHGADDRRVVARNSALTQKRPPNVAAGGPHATPKQTCPTRPSDVPADGPNVMYRCISAETGMRGGYKYYERYIALKLLDDPAWQNWSPDASYFRATPSTKLENTGGFYSSCGPAEVAQNGDHILMFNAVRNESSGWSGPGMQRCAIGGWIRMVRKGS